jgi:hypothetical protein
MIRIILMYSIAFSQLGLPSEVYGKPLIGAIRWDGWFQDNPWQKNLNGKRWHYRLPFFAEVLANEQVLINGDSQHVMDREIQYAKAGGLDYWAFCYYHPSSWQEADKYNYGWKRYLDNKDRQGLNFCLLLQGGQHMGKPEDWAATVDFFVGLFKDKGYQRVGVQRPLVYLYTGANLPAHFGSSEAARSALDAFRQRSCAAGQGNPYLVAQIWTHEIKEPWIEALGFDAVGSYSAHGSEDGEHAYTDLMAKNKWYWDTFAAATGHQVVPTVNTGWDGQPRDYKGGWYHPAKPEEIALNLKVALEWMQAHPALCPANTVLFYAWNEYDEGGWLSPTIEEGDARLKALRIFLDKQ